MIKQENGQSVPELENLNPRSNTLILLLIGDKRGIKDNISHQISLCSDIFEALLNGDFTATVPSRQQQPMYKANTAVSRVVTPLKPSFRIVKPSFNHENRQNYDLPAFSLSGPKTSAVKTCQTRTSLVDPKTILSPSRHGLSMAFYTSRLLIFAVKYESS